KNAGTPHSRNCRDDPGGGIDAANEVVARIRDVEVTCAIDEDAVRQIESRRCGGSPVPGPPTSPGPGDRRDEIQCHVAKMPAVGAFNRGTEQRILLHDRRRVRALRYLCQRSRSDPDTARLNANATNIERQRFMTHTPRSPT